MSQEPLESCPFCGGEMWYARNPKYCWHPHGVKCPISDTTAFYKVDLWQESLKRPATTDGGSEDDQELTDEELQDAAGIYCECPEPCRVNGHPEPPKPQDFENIGHPITGAIMQRVPKPEKCVHGCIGGWYHKPGAMNDTPCPDHGPASPERA